MRRIKRSNRRSQKSIEVKEAIGEVKVAMEVKVAIREV